ncbi:hypothetical protein DFH06DRAFT_625390 [Mycena polygramma]|nr:hypothetical protein DFH06DRAFT_625390 [Mycena polygramma]
MGWTAFKEDLDDLSGDEYAGGSRSSRNAEALQPHGQCLYSPHGRTKIPNLLCFVDPSCKIDHRICCQSYSDRPDLPSPSELRRFTLSLFKSVLWPGCGKFPASSTKVNAIQCAHGQWCGGCGRDTHLPEYCRRRRSLLGDWPIDRGSNTGKQKPLRARYPGEQHINPPAHVWEIRDQRGRQDPAQCPPTPRLYRRSVTVIRIQYAWASFWRVIK